MKKRITVILAAIFYISAVSAQDYARHRVDVNYGAGFAGSIYDKTDESYIYAAYSLGSVLELKYAYFFAPKWGVSIGTGISFFTAKGVLNMDGVIPHYNDPAFDPSGQQYYDLHYKADNLSERQRIWALETPLQFHFEHRFAGNRQGIYAGLGAKGYFPFAAQSTFPQDNGTLTLTGYEAFTDTRYTEPPYFGRQDVRKTPATTKLQYSIDAIADFGGLFRISDACDLFVGVYGSYGLMDVLPKTGDKKDFITPEHNSLFYVNSLLSSNIFGKYNNYIQDNHLSRKKTDEKWNRLQAGIKIGIHFKMK